MTFELPGLEKGPTFHLFLKGWEPSARTVTFDDEENDFRARFYENQENIPEVSKKSLFGNAKMRPDFRAAQNDCV